MGLFSSVGKFLFGGKSKKNETKTENDPWAPAKPYLEDYLKDTKALYDSTPLFGELEQQGIDGIVRATGQNQTMLDSAIKQNTDVLDGKYLTPDTNPYLADIAKRVSGMAGAGVQSQFGSKGRTGSGLAGYYGGKAIGDSLTDMYGSVYESERGRQEGAKGYVPALSGANTQNSSIVYGLGQDVNNKALDRNKEYGGILGSIGQLGGTQKTTEYKQTRGLFGDILNAGVNAFFGTTRPTG